MNVRKMMVGIACVLAILVAAQAAQAQFLSFVERAALRKNFSTWQKMKEQEKSQEQKPELDKQQQQAQKQKIEKQEKLTEQTTPAEPKAKKQTTHWTLFFMTGGPEMKKVCTADLFPSCRATSPKSKKNTPAADTNLAPIPNQFEEYNSKEHASIRQQVDSLAKAMEQAKLRAMKRKSANK